MKRIAMTLVALVALTLTVMGQTISEGIYIIKYATQSDYVLTVKNGEVGDGNPLSVEKWKGGKAQQWKITVQNNCIVIRSMLDNNYVVDVNNYTPVDGREVYIYSFHGDTNQQWRIKSQGGSKVELLSEADHSFALTVVSGGLTQTYKDNGKNSQMWIFQRADGTTSTTPTTPTTAGGPSSYIKAPQNLEAYRNKVGQTFTFLVTAANEGSIWGGKNYIYSDNSDLARACRHSVLGKNHTNKVIVKILADQGSYPSYKHNGITSSQRGAWKGAYQIIGIPRTYVTSTDMSKYRNYLYEQVVVRVTGRRTGTVYGRNTGWGYMDKSDLATAAVHAGILKDGQTAYLTVRINPGSPRYDAAKMNKIQSRAYGKGEGTFKIVKASQTCPSNLSAATIR